MLVDGAGELALQPHHADADEHGETGLPSAGRGAADLH